MHIVGDVKMKKLLILVVSFLGLIGCTHTPSQVLISSTGDQAVRCAHGAWGWGIAGALAMTSAEMSQQQCIKNFRQMGYIEIEKFPVVGISFNVKEPLTEAIFLRIDPNSPAHKAGMKVGDKVIEKNSNPVKCVGDIMSIARSNIGDVDEYKVIRDGKQLTFKVKVVPLSEILSIPKR